MNCLTKKKSLVMRKPFLGKTLALWDFHPRCHFRIKDILLDVEAKENTCFTNYPLPIFQLDLVIIYLDSCNFTLKVAIKIYLFRSACII